MKVLHIHPYPPEYFRGSEIYTRNSVIQLKKKNIDCDLLTSDILKKNISFLVIKKDRRI